MRDFVLRKCRHGDLDQVVALERVAFAESAYSMVDFIYFLWHAREGFVVAKKDGQLLGYVIGIGRGGMGMIQSIAVSPESRRKGIAEALMKSAIAHLAEFDEIRLLVESGNAAAISLYRKLSFRETGRVISRYYRNGGDAVEMVRARS
jgi:ribosomal-protein-alanine N-acetyltransferase